MKFEEEFLLHQLVREVIIKCGDKWCLKHANGKGTLGTHNTREEAEAQERVIHAHGG